MRETSEDLRRSGPAAARTSRLLQFAFLANTTGASDSGRTELQIMWTAVEGSGSHPDPATAAGSGARAIEPSRTVQIVPLETNVDGYETRDIRQMKYPLVFANHAKGIFYFRVLGYGLWFARYDEWPALFSERNGYLTTIPVPFTNWRIKLLAPDRKARSKNCTSNRVRPPCAEVRKTPEQ